VNRPLYSLLFGLALAISSGSLAAAASPDTQAARKVVQAYLNSLREFTQFECDFTVSFRLARDRKSALNEGFPEVQHKLDYQWSQDGDRECFRVGDGSATTLAAANATESILDKECQLKCKDLLLSVHGQFLGLQLTQVNSPLACPMSPLQMGNIGPRDMTLPFWRMLNDPDQTIQNFKSTADSVSFEVKSAHSVSHYSFDRRRNNALSASTSRTGNISRTFQVTEWKDCGNGRWFPIKSVQTQYSPEKRPVAVAELSVTRLVVDKAVAPERFQIHLPSSLRQQLEVIWPSTASPEALPEMHADLKRMETLQQVTNLYSTTDEERNSSEVLETEFQAVENK
jgi:hypothetical protein